MIKYSAFLFFTVYISVYTVAQTTSGTTGTITPDPDAPAAETFNLKLTQKMELAGMLQTRYQFFEDTSKNDAFDLRRARLVLRGDVAPKIGYRLQLELANGPKIIDAVFTYKPKEYFAVNIGQSKTPYCYDNYYSPFTLLAVSRTQIDNALSFRENDLYHNNQGRDIGLWVTGKYSIGEEAEKRPVLEYHLGVYNGAGINVTDNNNDKDVGGFLRVSPVKNLWVSARAYKGFGAMLAITPDSTADRTRIGGDITYKFKNFLIEAEYLKAEDKAVDTEGEETAAAALERSGYYVTLGYTIIKNKCDVIVRLDNYDADIQADLNAINKYVLAASWYFSKTTRVQLEYNFVVEEDSQNPVKNNLFAIQVQAGF